MEEGVEGVGARLRLAIAERFGRDKGVSEFAAALAERSAQREAEGRGGIRGISRAMVYRYTSDNPDTRLAPTLEFIEAAAEVLGVPFTWLATGRNAAEELFGPPSPPADEIQAMREGIAEAFPWGEDVPEWALQAPGQALVSYIEANPELREDDAARVEVGRDFGRRMGRAIAGPLEAFDLHPDALDYRELRLYVVGLTSLLSGLDLRSVYRVRRQAEDVVRAERERGEATTSGEG